MLPPDSHVHSQWSWDAPRGSMEDTCAQARRIGLPAVAFTEHVDRTRWVIPPDARSDMPTMGHRVGADARFDPPALDVQGYLEAVERCRARYPDLRIMTGVELGEPHWFPEQTAALVGSGSFERILGSLHSVGTREEAWLMDDPTAGPPPDSPVGLVRDYLDEAARMVAACGDFAVLAHIDYPARGWPVEQGPFPLHAVAEELRSVLRALASTDRALEVNTRVPLDPEVLRWWVEEGGRAVTFGSDAHEPLALAVGFADAAALAEAHGFRPGRHPWDVWRR